MEAVPFLILALRRLTLGQRSLYRSKEERKASVPSFFCLACWRGEARKQAAGFSRSRAGRSRAVLRDGVGSGLSSAPTGASSRGARAKFQELRAAAKGNGTPGDGIQGRRPLHRAHGYELLAP